MHRLALSTVFCLLMAAPSQAAIMLQLDSFPATTAVSPGDTVSVALIVGGLGAGNISLLEGIFTFTDSMLASNGVFLWSDEFSTTDIATPGPTSGTVSVSFAASLSQPAYTSEAGTAMLYFDLQVTGPGPGSIRFDATRIVGVDSEGEFDGPLSTQSLDFPGAAVPEPTSVLSWSLLALGFAGYGIKKSIP